MAKLSLQHVYKIYPSRDKGPSIFKRLFSKQKVEAPKDFVAVKDFNLEISDGEFVVFVGPSGCGKSTTLRMIAGLEDISAGELYMDNVLLNNVDPMNRDMAMVFQSYALYPHLSAYDNIAFGLKMRKIEDTIKDKDGNVVKGIDREMLKSLSYKIKSTQREINRLSSYKERIVLLDNLISSGTLKEKQLEKCKRTLEITKSKYSKEKVSDANEKLINLNKQLEYYSKTEVELHHKRHYTKEEIAEKVNWAADILGIKELLKRKPSEMSGGQMQRVALGRAIVRGPKVFLLDEPLSNLDAKLRTSMRSEIVKLHQRLKTTFVYVTHDQIEAMTMGTRIVVMKDGVIQQVDTPTNIFNYPSNTFVAGFIGTPQMNFFDVKVKKVASKLETTFSSGDKLSFDLKKMRKIDEKYLDGKEHDATLGVRAEHLLLSEKGVKFNLSIYEILGSDTHLFVRLGNEPKEYIISTDSVQNWQNNQDLHVNIEERNIHLFDKESGVSILEGAKHD